MIKIAICDENQKKIEKFEKLFSNYAIRNTISGAVLYTYSSVSSLINDYVFMNGIDILFVDEAIKDEEFIGISEKIKHNNMECKVIYLADIVSGNKNDNIYHKIYDEDAFNNILKNVVASVIGKNNMLLDSSNDNQMKLFATI